MRRERELSAAKLKKFQDEASANLASLRAELTAEKAALVQECQQQIETYKEASATSMQLEAKARNERDAAQAETAKAKDDPD